MKHDERMKYYNPQCIRENFIDLCGTWSFQADPDDIGMKNKWYENADFIEEINVPFAYQSELSNVKYNKDTQVIWYKRNVELKVTDQRIVIYFEAVDFHTTVWLNGHRVCEHKGGFTPFQIDLTDYAVDGTNGIVIRVEDGTWSEQVLGKQSWKEDNFLCWYTKTMGIWQPVWIELLPEEYIKEFYIVPNSNDGTIEIEVYMNALSAKGELQVEVFFDEKLVNQSLVQVNRGYCKQVVYIQSDDPNFRMHYWSVDEPNLYDVRLTYNNGKQQDAIDSYFGMRTFDISGKNILINNDVFYHKLILNQGYYDKGLMTPPTQDWYVNDIIKIKEMGFNGMRIHQKVEQHRLLYLCDHYGLVVWAEMPSFYEFNRRSKELYVKELVPFMKKHMNHPSVIVWTLFNESWGVNGIYGNQTQQQFVNSVYELAKSIDSTRMIIGNDGWEHTKTDILTIHDYTSEAEVLEKQYKNIHMKVNDSLSLTRAKQNFCKGYSYQNEPILISEFGGVAFSKYDNYDNSWGYGSRLDSEEKVINKIRELLTAVMDIEGLCGFCYTQLTDVEQEINGLLNHQHEYKFDVDEIKRILKNQQVYGLTFE